MTLSLKEGRGKKALEDLAVDHRLARRLPLGFVKRYRVIPLRRENNTILVGMGAKEADPQVIDDLKVIYGMKIRPCYMDEETLNLIIASVYYKEREEASEIVEDLKKKEPSLSIREEVRDLLETREEGPVIALVNSLLSEAVRKRASDIHIEPFDKDVRVRYRIDGVLYNSLILPKNLLPNISSRVKVMASLDVAEKRIPQDGKIRVKVGGRDIDIRVSIIPTFLGERVVLRILNREDIMLDLEELGLGEDELKRYSRLITRDHGLILVTGPTGAGKTTTLYASLSRINSPDKNIITIEDPVEYQLEGIGQIQVNPKVGLTFARGLRHVLRQDPDIIMVGEIRDRETAEIAVHASLTGHLVFSTLHTNDAAGAITRLLDMGIEPYLVASSLIGILAQRLVRVLCQYCKRPFYCRVLNPALFREYGKGSKIVKKGEGEEFIVLYRNGRCDHCFRTGYLGRTGIFELLVVNDRIRRLIVERVDSKTIREEAVRGGMITLRKSGYRKILQGLTTREEVMRVTEIEE